MQTFAMLDVVGMTLFAWFCLAKLIPGCTRSMFRYRLWCLRDGLADEVLEGAFRDPSQPERLIRYIEGVIELAPEIGALKLLAMRWSCRHIRVPKLFDLDALDPRDRVIVQRRLDELRLITIRHVLFGAPSGWLLTAVVVPLAILTSILEHIWRVLRDELDGDSVIEEARHRVRDDVEVDAALALLGRKGAQSARPVVYSV